MSGDQLRPMPIHVRRYPAETETSYLNRLFDAHALPERWRDGHFRSLRKQLPSDSELADVLGGVPVRPRLRRIDVHVESCSNCAGAVGERWVCTHCTAGAAIPQDPHAGPYVCRRHRRWVAPGVAPEDQVPVDYAVSRTDRVWQRLLSCGRATTLHGTELDALVSEWAVTNAEPLTAAARFVRWVGIWSQISKPSTLEQLTNPWQPYAIRHASVGRIVDNVMGTDGENAALQDGIWAMLRATALLRRSDLPDCEIPLQGDPHILIAPPPVEAPIGPLPPNEHYFRPVTTSRTSKWEDLNQKYTVLRSSAGIRWVVSKGAMTQLTIVCPLGHRMVRSANVTSRVKTTLRFACVYCAGKRALKGYRSLADSPKVLQTRWHPLRNGDLTPGNVAAASNRNVWWICSVGHEFDQPVSTVFRMDNCPVCLNYRIYPGVNDLLTVSPPVAAEWHPTRNGNLTPQDVGAGSATIVWWRCDRGHEWRAEVSRRKTRGCPGCWAEHSERNTLEVVRPDLAKEWHPTLNGERTPASTGSRSGQKVWWLCDAGHAYAQTVAHRFNGSACQFCRNKQVLPGFNDAFTRMPDLMTDWDWSANADFNPRLRLPGGAKHWWRCRHGHACHSTIQNRRLTGGCVRCPRELRVSSRRHTTG